MRKHLHFKGIPLNGNIFNFCTRLDNIKSSELTNAFEIWEEVEWNNSIVYSCPFEDRTDKLVFIHYSPVTSFVFCVQIFYFSSTNWAEFYSKYVNLKKRYSKLYRILESCENAKEVKGYKKLDLLFERKAKCYSLFDSGNGKIFIGYDPFELREYMLSIVFIDNINCRRFYFESGLYLENNKFDIEHFLNNIGD